MRHAVISALAVLALPLAGCGGSSDDAVDPGAQDAPAPAPELVADAVRSLAEAGSASFTSRVALGPTSYEDVGSFALDPAAQEFTRTADAGGTAYTIEARAVDGAFYVALTGIDADEPCWLTGDPETLAAATGASLGSGDGALPAAAYVAASAIGREPGEEDGEVRGTVDLARAAALVSGQLPEQLGVEVDDQKVVATLTVSDGVLSGISIDGDALAHAAEKAGLDDGADTFPDGTMIEVTFADVGEPVDVEAPEAKSLPSSDASSDPAATLSGCA